MGRDKEVMPVEHKVVDQFSQREVMNKYINAGFGLIAINGTSPKNKTWEERRGSDSDVADHGNWAAVLSDSDLIVSVDSLNGGVDSYNRLIDTLYIDEFETFTVKTGIGEAHFYFKKPPGIQIKKTARAYPGIEFITKGDYVLGPWSIHPETGNPYVIFSGSLNDIQDAPAELLALIRDGKKVVEDTPMEYIEQHNRYKLYLEREPALSEDDEGKQLYQIATFGRSLGLSQDQTFSCISNYWNNRNKKPYEDSQLVIKIANAYRYGAATFANKRGNDDHDQNLFRAGQWVTTKDGKLKKHTLANAIQYLITVPELKGLIRFNEFTQEIELSRAAPWHSTGYKQVWDDSDDIGLQYYLEHKYNYQIGDLALLRAVSLVSGINKYHPVKEWLESTKWDGRKRIDTWLHDYLGVSDNDYTREVGKLTLFGAIHRIYSPGCKFDYVLVLEGKPGIGKSTAVEILSNQWFTSGAIDFKNKATIDIIRGKWIIELAEMEALPQREAVHAKAFISRRVDRARLSCTKRTKDFPRQCIFIGTINPNGIGYLKDETGNRRYWPVLCRPSKDSKTMELTKLSYDVNQIWAEALSECRTNPGRLYIDNNNILFHAEGEQRNRMSTDELASVIADWAKADNVEETGILRVWTEALGGTQSRFPKPDQARVTKIIVNELGWLPICSPNGKVRTYRVSA